MENSTREYDLSSVTWYKSSYSAGDGGDCLEVAPGLEAIVPIRDSKNPHGPKLTFRTAAWSAFIADVKDSSQAAH